MATLLNPVPQFALDQQGHLDSNARAASADIAMSAIRIGHLPTTLSFASEVAPLEAGWRWSDRLGSLQQTAPPRGLQKQDISSDREPINWFGNQSTGKTLPGRVFRIDTLRTIFRRRHGETWKHLCRVSYWAGTLALESGWKSTSLSCLRAAALLHDIGKVVMSPHILEKPGCLSEAEFAIAKLHTLEGACILSGSKVPMLKLARRIALCHHENWDGTGYPFGLAGTAIPLGARIVAVADIYDALRCDRSYRSALPEVEVQSIMRGERGRKLDPQLLDQFLDIRRRRSRTMFALCTA